MGILEALFGSKFNPNTFEKDIAIIQSKIARTEKRLVSFKRNSRKLQSQSTVWIVAVYVVYLGYLYTLRRQDHHKSSDRAYLYYMVATVVTPFLILAYYHLVGLYNGKIVRYYLHKVRFYRAQYDRKIADLKNTTNFDRTRSLLQKYSVQDFHNSDDMEVDNELKDDTKALKDDASTSLSVPNENISATDLNPDNNTPTDADSDDDVLKNIEMRLEQREKIREKRELIRKGQYGAQGASLGSKILSSLMGSDEMAADNRYALICFKCFKHNGLAPPRYFPHQVQYTCPGCGYLNGEAAESPLSPSFSPSE